MTTQDPAGLLREAVDALPRYSPRSFSNGGGMGQDYSGNGAWLHLSDVRALAATGDSEGPLDVRDDLAIKMALRLYERYRDDPAGFAALCDEQIDRSGNLLGWLREYARLSSHDKPAARDGVPEGER